MQSTMQNVPLTVAEILRYAVRVHGDRQVTTATGDGFRHASYREVGRRAARLANALRRIGIDGDQRVATFMWNNQEHLEAYVAVPSMGAVLHTLNIRLFPEQIEFVAYEAEDRVVIADVSLIPILAPVLPRMETVHTVIAVGAGTSPPARLPAETVLRYHGSLLRVRPLRLAGDRRTSAAAMCYPAERPATPRVWSTGTGPVTFIRRRSAAVTAWGSVSPTKPWRSCRCSTPMRGDSICRPDGGR